MDERSLHLRRILILWSAMILSFFTSMSKVLVPRLVLDDLHSLGFSAGALGALGAGYMYTYAFNQMAVGIFSDRYGGVRLLLFGGGFFVTGSLLFPLSSTYWVMFLARMLAGMGSGTVFLGLAKLIADIYSDRFAFVFGGAMFLSYLGPIAGLLPMTWLVGVLGWRKAMMVPEVCSAVAMLVIVFASRGCMKPPRPGNCFAALGELLRDKYNRRLFGASSVVFGSYYSLLTVAGQKCLEDVCGMTRLRAALLLTVMAVLVAFGNLLTSAALRWCGGRRKVIFVSTLVCSLAGSLLGAAAFQWHLPTFAVAAAFVLLALSAGFFSLFAIIAKDLNPPERSGIAVSTLNFTAFVMIAVVGHLSGLLLNRYSGAAKIVAGVRQYPSEAYRDIFILFAVFGLLGLVSCFGVPETRDRSRSLS